MQFFTSTLLATTTVNYVPVSLATLFDKEEILVLDLTDKVAVGNKTDV